MHDEIEQYRSLVMSHLRSIPTFKECEPIWEKVAGGKTSGFSDAGKVLDLGSKLQSLFVATKTDSRSVGNSQSAVAKAGVAWEGLVVWYLNLVFSGTNAIATTKVKHLLPDPVENAISINYGSFQTNSESDVIVIVLPEYNGEPLIEDGKILPSYFGTNIHKIEVGVLQCKTSWADNAQIPMLWDMVYRLAGNDGSLSVGKNGFSKSHFRKFTYSFVATPSQKDALNKFLPTHMPVKRVRNLSGGNFWGLPSKGDVALSFKEIFTRNFGSAFNGSVPASIDTAISHRVGLFEKIL